MMKVWLTKYALTQGITVAEVRNCSKNMVYEENAWGGNYYHWGDWHMDERAALARAEAMRIAKLESLRKSIAKLQALRFSCRES